MEALHREQLAVIDRTLFDERVRTYAESEVKLKEVEAAASEVDPYTSE